MFTHLSISFFRLVTHEERQRFFDETRERLFQTRLNDNDPIGQFVREHHERFAALTASIMGDPTSAGGNSTVEVGKQLQSVASTRPHPTLTRSDTQPLEATSASSSQQASAADLVASILNRYGI